VLRGASWNNNEPENLLSSYRNYNSPDNRKDNNGFRCVLVVGGSARRRRTLEMRRDAGWVCGLSRRCQEVA
jgi:hypothetical protein